MILTGKCREDFKDWLSNFSEQYHKDDWLKFDLYLDEVYLPHIIVNALIVTWFDSLGYYCDVVPTSDENGNIVFIPNLIVDNDMIDIDSGAHKRNKAFEISIQHANNEYNKQK